MSSTAGMAATTVNNRDSNDENDAAGTEPSHAQNVTRAKSMSIAKAQNVEEAEVELLVEGELPWFADARSGATTWPQRLFVTLEDPGSSTIGKWSAVGVMLLILFSSAAFVAETMPSFNYTPDECPDDPALRTVEDCEPQPDEAFAKMETIAIILFSIEYMGRLLTVWSVDPALAGVLLDEGKRMNGLVLTWKYATQGMNLIDFAAIAPYYLGLLLSGGTSGLAVLRILRLARVFRVFKVGKHAQGAAIFLRVIAKSLPAMYLLAFFLAIAMVLFGSIIFFAEGGSFELCEDPTSEDCDIGAYMRPTVTGYGTEETPFRSITASFWWVLVTTTTVGYGDFYPTTTFGKIAAIITMHCGIIFLAMPITIVGANFANEYSLQQKRDKAAADAARAEELEADRELEDMNDPAVRRRKLVAEVHHMRTALKNIKELLEADGEEMLDSDEDEM